MTAARHILRKRLLAVGRRRMLLGTVVALAWSGIAATLVIGVAAWLDLLWELPAQARVAALGAAGLGGLTVLLGLAVRSWRAAGMAASARRLDEVDRSGGVVLTGFELQGPLHAVQRTGPSELSAGLAALAVEQAAQRTSRIAVHAAVPWRTLTWPLGTLAGLAALLACLALVVPALFRTEWRRLRYPYADVPPYSPIEFQVMPGDVAVVYGDALEIRAAVRGGAVEDVELLLEEPGRAASSLPMFAEPGAGWRAALAKVTQPGAYWVQAHRARSRRYQIRLITVPQITGLRVRVTAPAYTRLPPVDGPLAKEGVAGLAGTRVEVRVASNRPLRGGKLIVSGKGSATEVPLRPLTPGGQEVVGEFAITAPGKFQVGVEDVDRQASRENLSGTITLLADQRPFVRIVKPLAASLATPTATLPVVLSGEDDYGLSRVQLYRSLNDSRALPADLAVDQRTPQRFDQTVYLPLARYGLEPGDTIKLFGRVEDNDPAGAKGSESSMVTVRIISQAEFERLVEVRRGLEVLLSKYAEAQRRMDKLAREIEQLQARLAALPPKSPLAAEARQALQRLAEQFRSEAEALERLASQRLPYDIDATLSPELRRVAKLLQEGAQAAKAMAGAAALPGREAAQQLDRLAKRLGLSRQDLRRKTSQPLEHLAAIFPLIVDQQRFVALAIHQQELASRMASLRNREDDDPALKARMRELEEEQREIRSELGRLLDDIADHVERLPNDPRLDGLRHTAREFVSRLRVSGAAKAMSAAEGALAEFAGALAYAKAQQAADILARFIKQCNGMGTTAGECLAFQPTLASGLGNSIAQLLGSLGLGGGYGSGGYSAARGPNVGLYGGLPGMAGMAGFDGGGDDLSATGRGTSNGGANPDRAQPVDRATEAASGGTGEGLVPLEYRRRVGQYFQRIAEEAMAQ